MNRPADGPGPSLWFDAPIGFTELPLDADPEDRTVRVLDGLDAFYPQATAEQKLSAALSAEAGLRAQLAQGLCYAADCRYLAEDGQVILGTFQLFARPEPVGEPLTFAQRNARQLAAQRPDAEVGVLGLPCGRALVATEDRVVPVPAGTYGTERHGTATIRQLEVLLAHPDASHLLVLVFGTEHVAYWEEWLPVLAQALGGLSFYPPAAGGPGATPAGDRIRAAFG
ncbi:hypothetical protein [Kitasatospora viridis]|uniref:Uncharacterized protein n=1 Tax=Kitasatospora viridis TaxID=281105 RepID=A0A561T6B1_9ACTN|nr:hypothetical protein [Kitasatospora viridis]TWF82646.1 hypothetical protein FHX73_14128 [Kitasatospora viridis]